LPAGNSLIDKMSRLTPLLLLAIFPLSLVAERAMPSLQRYSDERGQSVDKHLITADPGIMMGKPVVAGTRITVELILEKLAAGETMDQILCTSAAHAGSDPRSFGVRRRCT